MDRQEAGRQDARPEWLVSALKPDGFKWKFTSIKEIFGEFADNALDHRSTWFSFDVVIRQTL